MEQNAKIIKNARTNHSTSILKITYKPVHIAAPDAQTST